MNPGELERAIDTAIAVGYRHIDTAFIYGTEKVIGQTLQKWFKSGKLKREEIFITTKLPVMGTHPDRVDSFIQRSLSNLQLDYVDLYLVHFPVGAKSGSNNLPLRDEQGHLFLEPKTDHAAIWKVTTPSPHAPTTQNLHFVENGGTVRRRSRQKHRLVQLQHLPNPNGPQIRQICALLSPSRAARLLATARIGTLLPPEWHHSRGVLAARGAGPQQKNEGLLCAVRVSVWFN